MFNEPNDSGVGNVRKSPYSLRNPLNPYRGFGAMTWENPIGTEQVTTHGLTRRGQLRGFDGGIGPAVPATSGFGGFGDLVSDAKTFLLSSTGIVVLLGILGLVGWKKGWFSDLD